MAQRRIRIEKVRNRPEELDLYPLKKREWKQLKEDRLKVVGGVGVLHDEIDVLVADIDDLLDPEDEPEPLVLRGRQISEIHVPRETRDGKGTHNTARGMPCNGLPDRRQSLYLREEWLPPSASPGQWPVMFCLVCARRAVIYKPYAARSKVWMPIYKGNRRFEMHLLARLDARCIVHVPAGDLGEVGGDNPLYPISMWRKVRGLSLPRHRELRMAHDGPQVYRSSPYFAFLDRQDRANYLFRRANEVVQ